MSLIATKSCRVVRVGGPLAAPAANARQTWRERHGLLIELTDDRGNRGRGEASPLPGYSPDSLAECAAALERVAGSELPALSPAAPLAPQIAAFVEQAGIGANLPAARFAVECALFDLAGQKLRQPVASLLCRAETAGRDRARETGGEDPNASKTELPLAALVADDRAEIAIASARAALDRGVRTLKLKVGRPDFAADCALVAALRELVGSDGHLRIDVNGAWSLAEAPSRLAALARWDLEFVEQPVPPADLARLGAASMPIAADESLHDPAADLDALFASGVCQVAVLKPMVMGGLLRSLEIAALARRRGVVVVISHLYDGPVALAAYAELALCLGASRPAHGLAPHAALAAYTGDRPSQITPCSIRAVPRFGLGLRAETGEPS